MEDKEESKDYEMFIIPDEYKKAQEELTNQIWSVVFEPHPLFNIVSTHPLTNDEKN